MSQTTKNPSNTHLLATQEKWINMTGTEIKRLFGYYIFILFASLLWMTFSVLYHYVWSESGFPNVVGIFMFAFPSGVLGASVYYIRKLYKSCIQKLVVCNPTGTDTEAHIRKIGAKIYFYFRPVISGVLAILASIALVAGFYIINNQPSVNNEKFFLFVILISFYIGFCNGKLILKMESQGNDVIDSIFKEDKNGTQQ